MERFWFLVWMLLASLLNSALPLYRDKNNSARDADAVQVLLARYLQKRLQGAQLSTPPPPSVFFSLNHQARVRSASQMKFNSDLLQDHEERRDRKEDYDDYEDDLQGFEDTERGRTRINLFSGN
ncbi:uncharacterized protein LOC107268243 [Cephus cinctus]|uniref:Uncharacterized protein LOC107268243 n=1 Tax=Cephus cinctus TaxID=211228 RepID=A0AAJ7W289_CEPCN|nr:uncharacterized protein LOC107268243 [Cephus cinctus]